MLPDRGTEDWHCERGRGVDMENSTKKLKLPQVTLVAMTSVNVRATIKAMQYSMRGIDFGDAVLITHKKPFGLPKCIRYSHTDKLNNIDDFNYKMVYELGSHIRTDFALIVHADGFVVHPEDVAGRVSGL